MADKWERVASGIRCRVHPTRKHGIRPDRYFVLRYTVNGQRKQEALGWASEGWTVAGAQEELVRLKKAARTGQGPATMAESRQEATSQRKAEEERQARLNADGLTFGDFWKETYYPQAQQDKTPRSWKREDQFYRLWLKPVISELPLKEVSPIHLERVKQAMGRAGRSPRTIAYCLDVARQAFNVALRMNLYIGSPPTTAVKRPKADNRRLRYLSPDEAAALLDSLAEVSDDLHNMALLSLHCGLRAGEIFSLTWADVDLDKGLLTLRDTKSGTNRYAFLTGPAKSCFDKREPDSPDQLIFPSRTGGVRQAISKSYLATVNKLGLNRGITDPRQKVTFHTLRHTYASWLVMNGIPLYTVQKLLGHSTLAMTERYAHLAPDHMREAVLSIEHTMEQATNRVVNLFQK